MQAKTRTMIRQYAPCCFGLVAGLAVPHFVCVLLWGTAVLDMASSLGLSPFEYVSQFCAALQH